MAKKNNINITIASVEATMQEIYNDIVEQKNTANIIMKKMLSFMKTQEDMNIIGPVIKEQQKIINNCTEKKISLVKLQTILLKQNQGSVSGENNSDGKLNLNDEEKLILEKLLNSTQSLNDDDNNIKYSL